MTRHDFIDRDHQSSNKRVLVVVFLRGGADGLTICPPYAEQPYIDKRPNIRIHAPGESGDATKDALPLQAASGGLPAFGLAPAMAPLVPAYDDDKLLIVQAVGCQDPSRSHFAQQKNNEHAVTSSTPNVDGNGWLGRYLANTSPCSGTGALRGFSFGFFKAAAFDGGNGVTPAVDPKDFAFPGDLTLQTKLQSMYTLFGDPLSTALQNDIEAVAKLAAVDWDLPSGAYPSSTLGGQFKDAAAMALQLGCELEVINIDYDNIAGQRWDAHSDQNPYTGTYYNLIDDLARSMAAFWADLEGNRRVCVLVYSEFGRTLDENSSLGTDHGRGGVALMLGDGVNGGQVFSNWPGLDDASLDPPVTGDLKAELDIRDLQAEIAVDCLKTSVSAVIPDTSYTWTDHGLIG